MFLDSWGFHNWIFRRSETLSGCVRRLGIADSGDDCDSGEFGIADAASGAPGYGLDAASAPTSSEEAAKAKKVAEEEAEEAQKKAAKERQEKAVEEWQTKLLESHTKAEEGSGTFYF